MKGIAVDCIGLIGGVALEVGVPGAEEWKNDPNMHNYGVIPQPEFLWAACDRFMDRITLNSATVGDVLVMAFERDPQHFALISQLHPMYVIHAYTSVRRVVENGVNVAKAKILRVYRFRGVA